VNNGFLTKSEIMVKDGALRKKQINYTLTYQSIMELIMADKYVTGIVNEEITEIPEHLRAVPERGEPTEQQLVNFRIVQEIVNVLFHEHDLMIGQDGYLTEGLSAATIEQLRMNALIKAPADVAAFYKDTIDKSFFQDHRSRHFVFRNLI